MVLIIVSTDLDGESVQVGDLIVTPSVHDEPRVRFRYDADFVARGYPIDPALRLDTAPHELRGLPLAVEDAAPDHWGQTILQRAERLAASAEGRPSERLGPHRLLLGASDHTRQGALRFQTEQDGPYVDERAAIPPVVRLDTLLAAAEEVAADPNTNDGEAIKRLLQAGTSALGGARPKAAVVDGDALWLAKFPRPGDANDVPVWEMVALDVAARGGLRVPERRLVDVGGRHVLLVQRFDRAGDGRRIPYISARTLMGMRDLGASADYIERGIALRLRQQSPEPARDTEQLWRQAVLNLLINNTDNHLRNHGLLREGNGWALSPVFDLDPNPDTGSQFAVHFAGGAQRLTGLRKILPMAEAMGIKVPRAKEMLDELRQAVDGWDTAARDYGAPDGEIALLEDAFVGALPVIAEILDG